MIIGICGLIGSGKDTIADYLVNIHEFRRESFADTLKDAVAAVFNWDREMLSGRTKESRIWREQRDEWWSNRLGQEITPRWVLQYWGTEVARKGFHDDIWIASIENKIRNSHDNIVISDCRFPNEIKAIRDAGGIVIRVKRGPDPEWYPVAQVANSHTQPNASSEILKQYGIHPSESAWAGSKFDYEINNDADGFDALYSQVKNLVQDLRVAKQHRSF